MKVLPGEQPSYESLKAENARLKRRNAELEAKLLDMAKSPAARNHCSACNGWGDDGPRGCQYCGRKRR